MVNGGQKFIPVKMRGCVECGKTPSCTIKIHLNLGVVWCHLVVIFYWQLNDLWLDKTSRTTVAEISRIPPPTIWHPFYWPELRKCWVWEIGPGLENHFSLSSFPGLDRVVSWHGLVLSFISPRNPVPGGSNNFNLLHKAENRSQLS